MRMLADIIGVIQFVFVATLYNPLNWRIDADSLAEARARYKCSTN